MLVGCNLYTELNLGGVMGRGGDSALGMQTPEAGPSLLLIVWATSSPWLLCSTPGRWSGCFGVRGSLFLVGRVVWVGGNRSLL